MRMGLNIFIKQIFALQSGQNLLFPFTEHKNSAKDFLCALFSSHKIDSNLQFFSHTYNYGMNYARSGTLRVPAVHTLLCAVKNAAVFSVKKINTAKTRYGT